MPDFSKFTIADTLTYLSLLIALMTIIIPGLTTWISKRYDLSLKMLELTKEGHSKTYNRAYFVFQDFIEQSGRIVAIIDSGDAPSSKDIQKFESTALKCLIFLNKEDRERFDSFRIAVKIKLGQADPRGTPTPLEQSANFLASMFRGVFTRVDIDDLYSEFNQVIPILTNRLIELEKVQKQELDELRQSRGIRFLRQSLLKLSKGIIQVAKRIKLKIISIKETFITPSED
ncbi:hypothetical protein [Streptococcus suis]|uniref:hypothetical protein n=1 Tax=Streptococcus suis TaxID=1307 RepID=UPI00301044C6